MDKATTCLPPDVYINTKVGNLLIFTPPSCPGWVRLWPAANAPPARALDFGCGNGVLTSWLADKGFDATGLDLSASGVAVAKGAYPSISFSTDMSAENIARIGPFDFALCVEVIAHCSEPSIELKKIFDSLKPRRHAGSDNAYHRYLKNLAMALTGRLEWHTTLSPKG